MIFLLALLLIYILLGVARIVSDYRQPPISQPYYVRHPSILHFLFTLLTWPIFWWEEIRHPMPKEMKEQFKKRRELEKKAKKSKQELLNMFPKEQRKKLKRHL